MKQTMESVFELFPRRAKKQLAGTLSGGGRPELIMFDEPSLVLEPTIVRQLLHAVRLLNQKGLTMLLIEQNVALSLKTSQRAYVLENGPSSCPVPEKNWSAMRASAWRIWDFNTIKQQDGFNLRLRRSHCVQQRVSLLHSGNCTQLHQSVKELSAAAEAALPYLVRLSNGMLFVFCNCRGIS
jgi:energy-coupling factor transporter ATP-binding protein EcfA2